MSQSSKGKSAEARPDGAPPPVSQAAPKSGALNSSVYAYRAPDSCLTELAIRLGDDLSAAEVVEEARCALSVLLPNCNVEFRESGRAPERNDEEPSALGRSHSGRPAAVLDSAVRSLGRCEWPLTPDAAGPVLLLDLHEVRQPRELARVLDVGERVAALLSSALRRIALRERERAQARELLALRQRVIQAEKLAGYGQLVASVLHDLNSPLTAILTYTEYLHLRLGKAGIPTADIERLSRIRDAAETILRQTRGLVEYSCPPRTPFAPVDVSSVLQRALVLCEHELARANIAVQTHIEPSLPMLEGHADQLTQLFVNLFTNSAHAARPDNATLDIVASFGTDNWICVEVRDNGLGIQPEDIEHVFDPFYTTRVGSGSGLGLSIVRDIIAHHGGRIGVESVPLAGTTFRLTLPRAGE